MWNTESSSQRKGLHSGGKSYRHAASATGGDLSGDLEGDLGGDLGGDLSRTVGGDLRGDVSDNYNAAGGNEDDTVVRISSGNLRPVACTCDGSCRFTACRDTTYAQNPLGSSRTPAEYPSAPMRDETIRALGGVLRHGELDALQAMNERKRKAGVSPPLEDNQASLLLKKRQRYPSEFSAALDAAFEAARRMAPGGASFERVTPDYPPSAVALAQGGVLQREFHVGQFEESHNVHATEAEVTEDDLVEYITTVLENICCINNGRIPVPPPGTTAYRSSAFPDGSSSIFFSLQRPAVHMRHYVARLVKYLRVSKSVFVVALIYLDRVHAADEILALTHLNVHRLITTALAIACKYLEDEVHRNSTVSRIGGVPSTAEMNLLELQFLRRINWDCSVSVDSYELYRSNVFKRREPALSDVSSISWSSTSARSRDQSLSNDDSCLSDTDDDNSKDLESREGTLDEDVAVQPWTASSHSQQ